MEDPSSIISYLATIFSPAVIMNNNRTIIVLNCQSHSTHFMSCWLVDMPVSWGYPSVENKNHFQQLTSQATWDTDWSDSHCGVGRLWKAIFQIMVGGDADASDAHFFQVENPYRKPNHKVTGSPSGDHAFYIDNISTRTGSTTSYLSNFNFQHFSKQ